MLLAWKEGDFLPEDFRVIFPVLVGCPGQDGAVSASVWVVVGVL